MTCYQRHMGWLFEAVGLPYDKDSRARVDAGIRATLGTPDDAHCPEVWAAIKELGDGAAEVLVPGVGAYLESHPLA